MRLTPGSPHPERPAPESADETFGAEEPDALDLHGVSVQHTHAGGLEDRGDLFGMARLVVVVSQHGDDRHAHATELPREQVRLLDRAMIGEIPAEDEDVCELVDGLEQGRERMGDRRLPAVEIADRGDANGGRCVHAPTSQQEARPERGGSRLAFRRLGHP